MRQLICNMLIHAQKSKDVSPGEFFKEARIKKGWTQDELAEKAGLGQNTYPKIERDENKPEPATVFKLLDALDIEQTPELLKMLFAR